jgi:PAS domain S-box-containing protein
VNATQTILILNKASASINFMAKLLEANGYRPMLIEGGSNIPGHALMEDPAVALFDLTVKGNDALNAMRKLNMRSPGTECIVIADPVSHESVIEAVKLGAFFYLQKPYEPEQLLLAIRRAIEKRQAAQAWAENEEKHRVLMDNIRDPIILYDQEGVLLSVNVAAAELLESTPDAIVGKTLREVHPDTADSRLETIRRVMASGSKIVLESERSSPRGSRIFLSTFHPVRNAQGKIASVQAIEYDITDAGRRSV